MSRGDGKERDKEASSKPLGPDDVAAEAKTIAAGTVSPEDEKIAEGSLAVNAKTADRDVATAKTMAPESAVATAKTIAPESDAADAKTMAPKSAVADAKAGTAGSASAQAKTRDWAEPSSRKSFDPSALTVVDRSHYEFLAEHGRGALGKISRARDYRTGRIVAIKEMLPTASTAGSRFAREAIITANLQHPSIVPVYEVGQWHDGGPFYAMKLVSGESLEDAMKAATVTQKRLELLPHVLDLAEAIAYAHEQGVVHRDLKPANVLVGDFGETVVIDWGLARRRTDSAEELEESSTTLQSVNLTMVGDVMGTPSYMSPEQATGLDVAEPTDVYAIGVILYELITGKTPFAKVKTVTELLEAVKQSTPKPVEELAPSTPSDLAAIVGKAMARDSADRYPSGRELAEDLRNFQTGQLVGARTYSIGSLIVRWVRRHRITVSVATVLIAALIVGGILSVRRIVSEKQLAVQATKVAEKATQSANQSLAAAFNQMAIRQLERGRSLRALTYASDAAKIRGTLSAGDRLVAGMAVDPLRSLHKVVIGDASPIIGIARHPQSGRLLAATASELRWLSEGSFAQVATMPYEGKLRSLAFLPEGQALVVNDGARAISQDGSVVEILDSAVSTHLSRDGSTLYLGTAEGQLVVRAVHSPAKELRSWKAAEGPVLRIMSDPTGAYLATDSDDVQLWDAATGAAHGSIEASAFPAFNPDGTRVLVISEFGYGTEVQVASVPAAGIDLRLDHAPDAVSSALFSADGSAIITTAGEQLRWWDAETGTLLYRRDVGFGAWIVTATDELGCLTANFVGRIEMHQPGASSVMHATAAPIGSVLIGGGSEYLVAASADGNIYQWKRPIVSTQVSPPKGSDEAQNIVFSADSSVMLVEGNDSCVELRTSVDGKRLATFDREITGSALSPGGKWLALADGQGQVSVHPATGEGNEPRVAEGADQARIVDLKISAEGELVALVRDDKSIEVYDVASGAKRISTHSPEVAKCIELSPDRRWAVACGANDESLLFDLHKGTTRVIKTGHLWTNSAAFHPDSSEFILAGDVASNEGPAAIVVTPGAGKATQLALPGKGRSVAVVAYSPRGERIVLERDEGIEVWDQETKTLQATMPIGGARLQEVAFDSSQELLTTTLSSGEVVIWNIESGMEVMRKSWGLDAALTLRKDGRQVAVRGDEALEMWTAPTFSGTIAELNALAECYSAWKIKNGAQVLDKATPARCSGMLSGD